nr:NADH dehydrogenase subunit 2 [Boccardiella hamata]
MLLIQWLFCWSLFSSTLVALSASMPLYTWAALEVNTIAFIPMMLDPNKPEAIRATMKYFFIQAYASLIFLIGPLLTSLPELTIFLAMLMKMGASPFHNWYPSVMASLNWLAALFLSTWQKIAPLWILVENTSESSVLPILAALNAMVGGIGGLIQTEIRPLLAFSSIGHMGWLIFSIPFSNLITLAYFLSYTIHLILIMLFMDFMKINTPKDLSSSSLMTPSSKSLLAMLLFSLGGLPPLLGFIPKLLVLWISAPVALIPLFLIIGSYMNIYYYMSILWSSYMANPQPILLKSSVKSVIMVSSFVLSLLILMLACGLNMHLQP